MVNRMTRAGCVLESVSMDGWKARTSRLAGSSVVGRGRMEKVADTEAEK